MLSRNSMMNQYRSSRLLLQGGGLRIIAAVR
jgi:hypothetical protein